MADSPGAAKARIRDAVKEAAAKGLDHAVSEIEQGLAALWVLERKGKIDPLQVASHITAIAPHLKKLAPPPPKKVKFDAPLRKILPLSEQGVRPGLDAAMLIMALMQVGDLTGMSEKVRLGLDLQLDDWRRMLWKSARITDWARFRELAGTDERELEGRLSRDSALRVLEAFQKRRADNIAWIPDLSMIACTRCGRFEGRDRLRCERCRGNFCARCLAPAPDLCLVDYAIRYTGIEPDLRVKIMADAQALLKVWKLDAHARNDAFVRVLKEEGVDVAFRDGAPAEGEETEASHGRRHLTLKPREGAPVRRVLFGALARCYFREAKIDHHRLLEDLFVDVCLGFPVGEALSAPKPSLPQV